ncbi:MAG: AAA family ATPase [Chromatiales bacterium]|nr:AAA family ATPase [Chromatiales bacterium]
MHEKNLKIRSLSLSGYRSFGSEIQRFERFGKINLFIGRNNSGKSNILRFIVNLYPALPGRKNVSLDALDRHIPAGANFTVGSSISLDKDESGNYVDVVENSISKLPENRQRATEASSILKLLVEKARIDGLEDAWFDYQDGTSVIGADWYPVFNVLSDREIEMLWRALTRRSGGSKDAHWIPETVMALAPRFQQVNAIIIPAIRKVGDKGSESEEFSGEGIIERLVRLQNPDVHNQEDRDKFNKINEFLRSVTDNKSATIEIPHERDTILVHMDGKTLPLESLGTGIHEVIILASAATILNDVVICMEEPELHLNPILQKKLVRYLISSTTNQYFITTHSAALMDAPGSEVYHVSLDNGCSVIRRVTSDRHRSSICEDLGYHPSDLLQSNCIVWVEGPSDRVYLNYWLHSKSPELVEGIHYSIMFYGGKLASHLSGNDVGELVDEFISLRRLNRRGVIVIDSDKAGSASKINATKKRLVDEFNEGPGFAWVTAGREIENYLSVAEVQSALSKVASKSKPVSGFGRYDNMLAIEKRNGEMGQASKVGVAKYIVENYECDWSVLDLDERVDALVAFIRESNPGMHLE